MVDWGFGDCRHRGRAYFIHWLARRAQLTMRALVVTGSRADRNGLEVVHEALKAARHDSWFEHLSDWQELDVGFAGICQVAVVGGDRFEILEVVVKLAQRRIPIAHIAGGDVTEGSADDRYRGAITALSCIHFATNESAYLRLTQHLAKHPDDKVYLTGSPAIDRIKQTPVLTERETYEAVGLWAGSHAVLVSVHPETVGRDPLVTCHAVLNALEKLPDSYRFVFLGANADKGGREIDELFKHFVDTHRTGESVFHANLSPQLYYSLMTYCDVMVGNSSAMLYEAPSFNCRCVLVGRRQHGRTMPENVTEWPSGSAQELAAAIRYALDTPCWNCANPYGDGHSAPRIVKAIEENAWRWTK